MVLRFRSRRRREKRAARGGSARNPKVRLLSGGVRPGLPPCEDRSRTGILEGLHIYTTSRTCCLMPSLRSIVLRTLRPLSFLVQFGRPGWRSSPLRLLTSCELCPPTPPPLPSFVFSLFRYPPSGLVFRPGDKCTPCVRVFPPFLLCLLFSTNSTAILLPACLIFISVRGAGGAVCVGRCRDGRGGRNIDPRNVPRGDRDLVVRHARDRYHNSTVLLRGTMSVWARTRVAFFFMSFSDCLV